MLALYPIASRSATICSASAVPTWSLVPFTTTLSPAVPDALTSACALAMSGADQVVCEPVVYGQYGT